MTTLPQSLPHSRRLTQVTRPRGAAPYYIPEARADELYVRGVLTLRLEPGYALGAEGRWTYFDPTLRAKGGTSK